jgi:hypothetical protein
MSCDKNDERKQNFYQLSTSKSGGAKIFTSYIWTMSGNYFAFEKLIDTFTNFDWIVPESVVLIINSEDNEYIQAYRADGFRVEGEK